MDLSGVSCPVASCAAHGLVLHQPLHNRRNHIILFRPVQHLVFDSRGQQAHVGPGRFTVTAPLFRTLTTTHLEQLLHSLQEAAADQQLQAGWPGTKAHLNSRGICKPRLSYAVTTPHRQAGCLILGPMHCIDWQSELGPFLGVFQRLKALRVHAYGSIKSISTGSIHATYAHAASCPACLAGQLACPSRCRVVPSMPCWPTGLPLGVPRHAQHALLANWPLGCTI
eukprot:363141-Chlamydomonas_euryale.AAC.5